MGLQPHSPILSTSYVYDQGLADVEAAMGQGMQFSLFLTQLDNTNTLANTRKWPLCKNKRSPFLTKLYKGYGKYLSRGYDCLLKRAESVRDACMTADMA